MNTPNTIDKSILRATAALTVVLLLVGQFASLNLIVTLLCVDALARGFISPALSPLYRAARAHTLIFRRKKTPVDAAPHRFAAKINGAVYGIIAVLAFCGPDAVANGMSQLMVLVAGVEAFAGISLGAKLHTRLHARKKPTKDTE